LSQGIKLLGVRIEELFIPCISVASARTSGILYVDTQIPNATLDFRVAEKHVFRPQLAFCRIVPLTKVKEACPGAC
jgi:hypothetical protein